MTDKEKLVELLAKAKQSMRGERGLDCDLAKNMYLAEHLIANGVTIQRWVSVEERLPEDEGAVLVCGSRKGIYTAEFRRNGNYHWFHKLNSKCHHCDPTHWMPLPEPPKGE